MLEKQAVYYMKDAVFAAADALKAHGAQSAGEAATKALLKSWFDEQSTPFALLADSLAVPVMARSLTQLDDYSNQSALNNGVCFVICSLSGRGAHARGLRDSCIAAAYIEGKEMKAAMVFDPSHAELFHAVKSLGAYMNGKSIGVSRCESMTDAYISFDHKSLRTGKEVALRSLVSQAQDMRTGAAFSLSLCHMASGRIDAAIGRSQSFIEAAAGRLIAEEAGAVLLSFDGKPLPPVTEIGERMSFAAVSPGIKQEMRELLSAL